MPTLPMVEVVENGVDDARVDARDGGPTAPAGFDQQTAGATSSLTLTTHCDSDVVCVVVIVAVPVCGLLS